MAVVLCGGLFLVIAVYLFQGTASAPQTTKIPKSTPSKSVPLPEPTPLKLAELDSNPSANVEAVPAPVEVSPSRQTPPFDPKNPETQPRAWYTGEFNGSTNLQGFSLEGLDLTENGLMLSQTQEGTANYGVLESPPQKMEMLSNAVTPYWSEFIPERSDVVMELALSPDGTTWSDWMVAHPDADSVGQISEFRGDGSPNPNYGYTPAGTFAFGNNQFGYFRYRITLYSETAESPIVDSVRFFYQDSTLGEGTLVQPQAKSGGSSLGN